MAETTSAVLALAQMRGKLLDLAKWADARFAEETYDRQVIAEFLAEKVRGLALDDGDDWAEDWRYRAEHVSPS